MLLIVFFLKSWVWFEFDLNINPMAGPEPCPDCDVNETDTTVDFRLLKVGGSSTWNQAPLEDGDFAYARYETDDGKPPALVVLGNAVGNRVEIE